MKKLIVTLTLILTLCSANLSYAADRYVTLYKDADGTTALSQVVTADEVAFILSRHDQIASALGGVSITKGAFTFDVGSHLPGRYGNSGYTGQPYAVVGPCTITYTPHSNGTSRVLLTIKISPNPNIMGVKQ